MTIPFSQAARCLQTDPDLAEILKKKKLTVCIREDLGGFIVFRHVAEAFDVDVFERRIFGSGTCSACLHSGGTSRTSGRRSEPPQRKAVVARMTAQQR